MSIGINRQILLKSRPVGPPKATDFSIVDSPQPKPAEGELLCRTLYLSLDPYMRGRMSVARSYAASTDLSAVMPGGTVSEVVESRHPDYAVGDIVLGFGGWQTHSLSRGRGLRKLDPTIAPISTALGVLGMPGKTAYVGLLDIGKPKDGETVVVSAASGAVGSAVGQIAKIKGCRAVGIAGSAVKCVYVTQELGFDACVDYKAGDLLEQLRTACPSGIDVYFDNVGGEVLAAVLRLINKGARIPLCGLISQYNATGEVPGTDLRSLLTNRAMIQGFIISDYPERDAAFLEDCTRWVRDGKLKYREDVVEGLENAPSAFLGLFEGKNFGKLLVAVASNTLSI